MATVRELVTKIVFSTDMSGISSAEKAIDGFKRSTQGVDNSTHMLGNSIGGLGRRVRGTFTGLQTNIAAIGTGLSSIAGQLGGIGGMFAAAFSASAIRQTADEVMNLDGRLRSVTSSDRERLQIEDKLYEQAQNSRTSWQGQETMFYKIAKASNRYGYSLDDTARMTDIVSKALVVGGASAQEAEATILQLGQALSSGVLQGDELHSLDENASGLMQHIAEQLGVNIGDLKKMGAAGELTSQTIMDAILKSGGAIDDEFGKMPMTIGQSFQQIGNGWGKLILSIQQKSGVFSSLGGYISSQANVVFAWINDMVKALDLFDSERNGKTSEKDMPLLEKAKEAHPILYGVYKTVVSIGKALSELGNNLGIDNIGAKIAVGLAAFTAVLAVLGAIGGFITIIGGAISAIIPIVTAVAGAFLPIVAVIAAIVLAIMAVKKHWAMLAQWFQPVIANMSAAIKSLQEAWEQLQPVIELLKPVLKTIAEIVGVVIVGAIIGLLTIASAAFRAIAGVIATVSSALNTVAAWIQTCADGVAGFIGKVENAILKAKELLGLGGKMSGINTGWVDRMANKYIGGDTNNNSSVINNTWNVGSVEDAAGIYQSNFGVEPYF